MLNGCQTSGSVSTMIWDVVGCSVVVVVVLVVVDVVLVSVVFTGIGMVTGIFSTAVSSVVVPFVVVVLSVVVSLSPNFGMAVSFLDKSGIIVSLSAGSSALSSSSS